MAKSSRPIVAIALPGALECIASQIASVIHESASISETLGALVREARASGMTAELVQPFTDGVRQFAEALGMPAESLKVYLSNIRGVLRAMLAGYEPADGAGLRAMYDSIPADLRGQGANGGNRKPRQPGSNKPKDKTPEAVPATRADLIRGLFGFHSDELEAALDYAKDHSAMFMAWAKASVKAEAAQLAEAGKKAPGKGATVTPMRKAA